MACYKPRAGAFRKVKYPLPIYRIEEIPGKDVRNVLNMVDTIKGEEISSGPRHQVDNEKSNGNPLDLTKKRASQLEMLLRSAEDLTAATYQYQPILPTNFPKAEISLVPEADYLYKRCYDKSTPTPRFPIKSSSRFSEINLSSDSEESVDDSEYDMDTEDEEWLEANRETDITPTRLEYIFAKLNKIDTQNSKKVIGFIPEAFRNDFKYLFPYWKEKRQNNRHRCTFKPKFNQTFHTLNKASKQPEYLSTDPYVIFARTPRKSQPRHRSSSSLKLSHTQEGKKYVKRILEMKEKLTLASYLASEAIRSSINDRDKIVKNFGSIMRNQKATRSGKENPSTQLSAEHRKKGATNVKSESVPARSSERLTNQEKKRDLQESSVNTVGIKEDAPSESPRRARVILKKKKQEINVVQGKEP